MLGAGRSKSLPQTCVGTAVYVCGTREFELCAMGRLGSRRILKKSLQGFFNRETGKCGSAGSHNFNGLQPLSGSRSIYVTQSSESFSTAL